MWLTPFWTWFQWVWWVAPGWGGTVLWVLHGFNIQQNFALAFPSSAWRPFLQLYCSLWHILPWSHKSWILRLKEYKKSLKFCHFTPLKSTINVWFCPQIEVSRPLQYTVCNVLKERWASGNILTVNLVVWEQVKTADRESGPAESACGPD